MFRGKVTNVTSAGVFVQTADFGTVGPCQAVNASYTAGDMVLCVNVGDDTSPDLVVIGTVSATGSAGGGIADPGTVTDNAVVRWDGTSGSAVQNSSVTIGDDASLNLNPTASGALYLRLQANAAANASYIQHSSGGVARFLTGATATGGVWEVRRYDDSGAYVGSALYVTRASGKVTIGAAGTTAGIELGSSGPTITTGTGAPSHSAPDGSLYLRTDGGAGSTLYVRETGAWVAK
jgi:hypothetical protein